MSKEHLQITDTVSQMRMDERRVWAEKHHADLQAAFPDQADILIRAEYGFAVSRIKDAVTKAGQRYTKEVLQSTTLNPEGKAEAAQGIAAEAMTVVDGSQKAVDKITDKITALEDSMVVSTSAEDPVLQYLKLQEIRTGLKDTTPIELSVVYERAINSGNTLLVQAIENAPLPYPCVTEASRATSRYNQIREEFPQELKQVEQLKTARDALTKYAGLVRTLL